MQKVTSITPCEYCPDCTSFQIVETSREHTVNDARAQLFVTAKYRCLECGISWTEKIVYGLVISQFSQITIKDE